MQSSSWFYLTAGGEVPSVAYNGCWGEGKLSMRTEVPNMCPCFYLWDGKWKMHCQMYWGGKGAKMFQTWSCCLGWKIFDFASCVVTTVLKKPAKRWAQLGSQEPPTKSVVTLFQRLTFRFQEEEKDKPIMRQKMNGSFVITSTGSLDKEPIYLSRGIAHIFISVCLCIYPRDEQTSWG